MVKIFCIFKYFLYLCALIVEICFSKHYIINFNINQKSKCYEEIYVISFGNAHLIDEFCANGSYSSRVVG